MFVNRLVDGQHRGRGMNGSTTRTSMYLVEEAPEGLLLLGLDLQQPVLHSLTWRVKNEAGHAQKEVRGTS